tara:strand:- start:18461 stop:18619 length:159 start_codon:yes stop_codon:yes gene_type:complete
MEEQKYNTTNNEEWIVVEEPEEEEWIFPDPEKIQDDWIMLNVWFNYLKKTKL